METLCKRFPHLAGRIFDQVDNKSLNKCKEISGEVLEYLDHERFFWIRIIMKYQKNLKDFPKLWKPLIDKTPVAKVKQIAIAVSQFFQLPNLYSRYIKIGLRKWSLIAISANHGDLALLQFVVKKIKFKNVRKTERINAMFLAAYKGHLETYVFLSCKLKYKNPGNTSLLNKWGRTPLHWAALKGHFGICEFIIENTNNKNPAASIKSDRYTPLHWAAQNGHLEVCKLIMENLTTDKNPGNKYGETPFHYATKNGRLAICQLMLDNLSDKNPATKSLRITPLHYAAQHGHLAVCKLIMENIVEKNPSTKGSHPSTPLSLATVHGKLEVCRLFHEKGIH